MPRPRKRSANQTLIVTVGGVSVGQRDYLPGTWDGLGFETLLRGVAIQPGKPVLFAKKISGHQCLVLGLPGNPVSVLTTAHLFLWPVIRGLLGLAQPLPWTQVTLSDPVQGNPKRELFRMARYSDHTRQLVTPINWQGSGDLSHTAAADGMIRLSLDRKQVQPGQSACFLPLLGAKQ